MSTPDDARLSGDQDDTDQDAEPTLNAPGDAGPTGHVDADADGSASAEQG